MHTYPCIMTEPLQPREVRDVEELRTLAHPMRQRILRRLHETGPATSTTLARDLGENSGIMSYHLRLLAGHDFVREVAGRGQGRERWWEVSPEPVWIPREGLSVEAQTEVSGLQPSGWAEDLEGFGRFRAARGDMGEWGRGTWVVRAHYAHAHPGGNRPAHRRPAGTDRPLPAGDRRRPGRHPDRGVQVPGLPRAIPER